MSVFERVLTVVMLVCIAIAAISWIGKQFHALLAIFDLFIGVVIGMTIFIPNRRSTPPPNCAAERREVHH